MRKLLLDLLSSLELLLLLVLSDILLLSWERSFGARSR